MSFLFLVFFITLIYILLLSSGYIYHQRHYRSLDGHIARQQKTVSDFGKLMDPLADKVLLCCGLLPLVERRLFPVWIAVVIITREFAVSGLRTLAAKEGKIIEANLQGKYKTTFQLSVIISILVIHGYHRTLTYFWGSLEQMSPLFSVWLTKLFWWLELEKQFLIWSTLAITIFSGIDYFRRNLNLFQRSAT